MVLIFGFRFGGGGVVWVWYNFFFFFPSFLLTMQRDAKGACVRVIYNIRVPIIIGMIGRTTYQDQTPPYSTGTRLSRANE